MESVFDLRLPGASGTLSLPPLPGGPGDLIFSLDGGEEPPREAVPEEAGPGLESPGEDRDMVEAFKGGDREKFRQLMEKYALQVFNTLILLVKTRQEAEALTGETFIQAYRSINALTENISFFVWLYRIALNRTLNYLRIQKRKSPGPAEAGEGAGDGLSLSSRMSHDPSEMQKIMHKALMQLSDNNRAAFVLVCIDGLTPGETADVLGIGVQAVVTRVERARGELFKMLKYNVSQLL